MNKLLLATKNAHKVGEINQILADYKLTLISLGDFPDYPEAPETSDTYIGNALQKAQYYSELTKMPCIADDSGLEIDYLDGAPGLHSSRFGGENLPHAQKIQMVLELLKDVPKAKRSARFRCTAVAWGLTPEPLQFSATCEGLIATAPAGCGGFGYDPIFFTPQFNCTLSELSAQQKNAISHRGQAMRGLARLIAEVKP